MRCNVMQVMGKGSGEGKKGRGCKLQLVTSPSHFTSYTILVPSWVAVSSTRISLGLETRAIHHLTIRSSQRWDNEKKWKQSEVRMMAAEINPTTYPLKVPISIWRLKPSTFFTIWKEIENCRLKRMSLRCFYGLKNSVSCRERLAKERYTTNEKQFNIIR